MWMVCYVIDRAGGPGEWDRQFKVRWNALLPNNDIPRSVITSTRSDATHQLDAFEKTKYDFKETNLRHGENFSNVILSNFKSRNRMGVVSL